MRIKTAPEDFVVDEIPAYEPCGEGEHLYVRFAKRELNTDEAVRAIAKALGANPRETGVAGLKDRVGITTQTASFFLPKKLHADAEAKASALALPGITIVSAVRHGNKLRTGHLRGNRFDIVLRELSEEERSELSASFDRIAKDGAPNAYGEQRFGKDAQNAANARAWLRGEGAAPKDPRQRRFLFSALQSEAFNHVLARRVADGTWNKCIPGDVLQKADSGGLFICHDVATEMPRVLSGEVSPTGPMFGPKMREAEAEALALEEESKRAVIGEIDWSLARGLGDGTRRALRLWVSDLRTFMEQDGSLRVQFVLPKGAYATTVISAATEGMKSVPGPR